MTATVVFNYSRELQQFGVLSAESNRVTLEPDLHNSPDKEEAIRARVSQALRRYKMYKLAADMLLREGIASIHQFASVLAVDSEPHHRDGPGRRPSQDRWYRRRPAHPDRSRAVPLDDRAARANEHEGSSLDVAEGQTGG